MDFIERIFGISPDGGSGSFEAALIMVPIVIAGLVMVGWKRAKSGRGAFRIGTRRSSRPGAIGHSSEQEVRHALGAVQEFGRRSRQGARRRQAGE